MNKLDRLLGRLTGKKNEHLSDPGFYAMAAAMQVWDIFSGYAARNFRSLGLCPGQTVVDYGCGPGRYLRCASAAVGPKGKVIAVDIHPVAVAKASRLIRRHNLANVTAVLAKGYASPVDTGIADVVYALEVFHMIVNPKAFLSELGRLVKKDGIVIVEDGHQSRAQTMNKIEACDVLEIEA